MLRLEVRDDGRGGAAVGCGSGLVGLTDRIEALGGRLTMHSPPGGGTTVQMAVPLTLHSALALAAANNGPPHDTHPVDERASDAR
jgi:glucose-6-phosphate-specific signal transduction histidine kinase